MATVEIKIGDHIKKAIDKLYVDEKIFKIVDLKEIKGGNWHDGFTISIIATIELKTDGENPETDTEEFCIQYINGMCQINNVYATLVD
jgi:hypothetical protein